LIGDALKIRPRTQKFRGTIHEELKQILKELLKLQIQMGIIIIAFFKFSLQKVAKIHRKMAVGIPRQVSVFHRIYYTCGSSLFMTLLVFFFIGITDYSLNVKGKKEKRERGEREGKKNPECI